MVGPIKLKLLQRFSTTSLPMRFLLVVSWYSVPTAADLFASLRLSFPLCNDKGTVPYA